MKSIAFRITGTLGLLLLLAGGCKKKPPVANPTPPPPATKPAEKDFGSVTVDAEVGLIRLKPGTSIQFATASDQLLDESKPTLNDVVAAMEQQPTMKIRLEGHTDSDGDDAKNLDLSTRRAASVKTYIQGKGIAKDRVDSVGCGETAPVDSNETDEGKQQNRRVEFVILSDREIPTCQVYQRAESVKVPLPAK